MILVEEKGAAISRQTNAPLQGRIEKTAVGMRLFPDNSGTDRRRFVCPFVSGDRQSTCVFACKTNYSHCPAFPTARETGRKSALKNQTSPSARLHTGYSAKPAGDQGYGSTRRDNSGNEATYRPGAHQASRHCPQADYCALHDIGAYSVCYQCAASCSGLYHLSIFHIRPPNRKKWCSHFSI